MPPALSSEKSSTGIAISEDGSVIAGDVNNTYGYQLTGSNLDIFTQTTPFTDYGTEVTTMSANGGVIAGWYFGAASGSEYAFQWTNGTFTTIPDTTMNSRAAAISADGSVVVGQLNYSSAYPQAFSWTQGSVTELPLPAGFGASVANGVSNNGSAIVGSMGVSDLNYSTAFIWDQANGTQNLKQVLTTDYGLGTALAGWTLTDATAITPNGNTIVGTGIDPQHNAESWIANLTSSTPAPTPDVSVASAPNPSTYGQPVAFTATVSAAASGLPTPTGTVTFMDGSTNLGNGMLNASGIATYTTTAAQLLPVGTDTITASYPGDSNFGSSSGSAMQTVTQAATITTVMSSSNPSTYGQSVTFTATVSPATSGLPTPTGSVQFAIDGSNFNDPVTLSNGMASITDAVLLVSGSPHAVSATYNPAATANFTSSTGTLTGGQTVNQATPTVSVSDTGGTSNGKAFPATATVAGANNTFAASLEGVSPTLTYYAGTAASGTPLSGAPSAAGTYIVVANFAGSADYTSASNMTMFVISETNLPIEQQFNIDVTIFIPGVYAPNPRNHSTVYGGDDHGFGPAAAASSYRARQEITVITGDQNAGIKPGSEMDLPGTSRLYRASSLNATGHFKPGTQPIKQKKADGSLMHVALVSATANDVVVRMSSDVSNALEPLAPGSSWGLYVEINTSGSTPRYSIRGLRSEFPALEIDINNVAVVTLPPRHEPFFGPYNEFWLAIGLVVPEDVDVSGNL